MGKKKPYVKKYRTNPDTISINMEQVCNADPLWPYKTETPTNDPRRLYKKGHQFCSPSEPSRAPKKRKLRRHGDDVNVDALSINLREHFGLLGLDKPDEVLPPSEINKLERAYRRNPSSLPPSEIRHQMDEGRQKNLESLVGRNPGKPKPDPHIYNPKEFGKILYESEIPSLEISHMFAIKGSRLINLVYESETKNVKLRKEMRLTKSEIKEINAKIKKNTAKAKPKLSNWIYLDEKFHLEHYKDCLRSMSDPGYKPKIQTIIDDPPYSPKQRGGY